MSKLPNYMKCYCTIENIKSNESKDIGLVKIDVPFDDEILISEWAKSFRRKYISDDDLREEIEDHGMDNAFQYLQKFKYPSLDRVKNGDFGEILVGEYLTYIRDYWVPSLFIRYQFKDNKEVSTKGTDIIALKIDDQSETTSDRNVLCLCEVKTGLRSSSRSRLQEAIDGSNNDDLDITDERASMSLAATKLKFKHCNIGKADDYKKIARFENPNKFPFDKKYLAAAVVDEKQFSLRALPKVTTVNSYHNKNLFLIMFHGIDLQNLRDAVYGIRGGKGF